MSLGSNKNTYLSKLIETGADAMTNLYYIVFSGSLLNDKYSDLPIALRIRNKDFTPPVFSQVSNSKKHFITTSVDFPMSQIQGTKELSLTFRVDKDYRVYQYLLDQQAKTGIANLGYANSEVYDSENGGFKISVYAFNRSLAKEDAEYANPENEECYQKLYEFDYCWIKSIDGLDYSYDNVNPLAVRVTIGFFKHDDPMNLLTSV